jgi:hypothetical protein
MTTRADFLSRLKPTAATTVLKRPLLEAGHRDVDEAGFRRRWEALGGSVHACAPAELAALVASIAAGRGPVLTGPGTLLDLVAADLRWPACGVDGAAQAGVAVVRGEAAIAATASIVLDSRSNGGRSAALLAPVAVFVVRREDLLPTPADVFRRTAELWPNGLPSQVVLVSGPSRSADIEMTLTRGVHGPGEVHAVFLDPG